MIKGPMQPCKTVNILYEFGCAATPFLEEVT